jgi:hypothetical protein
MSGPLQVHVRSVHPATIHKSLRFAVAHHSAAFGVPLAAVALRTGTETEQDETTGQSDYLSSVVSVLTAVNRVPRAIVYPSLSISMVAASGSAMARSSPGNLSRVNAVESPICTRNGKRFMTHHRRWNYVESHSPTNRRLLSLICGFWLHLSESRFARQDVTARVRFQYRWEWVLTRRRVPPGISGTGLLVTYSREKRQLQHLGSISDTLASIRTDLRKIVVVGTSEPPQTKARAQFSRMLTIVARQ